MNHPCLIIAEIAREKGTKINYGNTEGTCRITGVESKGVPFDDWIKPTFTDIDDLYPGDIISDEARFCFEEKSKIIQKMNNREKPQRFRTYSHFVIDESWSTFTKADKARMKWMLLNQSPEIACMSQSGQRHLLFKHKIGWWQLEDAQMMPDKELLSKVSQTVDYLYSLGFTQEEIKTGRYENYKVAKVGIDIWQPLKEEADKYRGSLIFDIAYFLMTKDESKNFYK